MTYFRVNLEKKTKSSHEMVPTQHFVSLYNAGAGLPLKPLSVNTIFIYRCVRN